MVPLTLPYLHSHFCIYPPQYLTLGFILSPYSFSHIISPGAVFLGLDSYTARYLFYVMIEWVTLLFTV